MPILKQGSSGPEVQDLQQKLKDLGFDPNGVDGNFGPGTVKAVRTFQQSQGLTADGVAGPATLAALQTAAAADAMKNMGGDAVSGGAVSASGAAAAPAVDAGLNLAGLAGKVPDAVIAQIPDTAARFGITTNLRLAHFLAQCALESMNFTAVVENLNYSSAPGAGISQVFQERGCKCLCSQSAEDRQPRLREPHGEWRRSVRRRFQVSGPRLHSVDGQE